MSSYLLTERLCGGILVRNGIPISTRNSLLCAANGFCLSHRQESSKTKSQSNTGTKSIAKYSKSKKFRRRGIEISPDHAMMIKVLTKYYPQLRTRIQLMREHEQTLASQQLRKTSDLPARVIPKAAELRPTKTDVISNTTPQEGLPQGLPPIASDRRLDTLSAMNVGDLELLDQDHLSNVSDFRFQTKEEFLLPYAKKQRISKTAQIVHDVAEPKKQKSVAESKALAEKKKSELHMRELNLKKLNKLLISFILACGHADMANHAASTVLHFREKYSLPTQRALVVNAHAFNILMSLFARQGRFDRVKEIFHWMKVDSVAPDARSFALAFEALGREPNVNLALAQKIANQMESNKISFDDIFKKCSFFGDSYEKILRTAQSIRPGFRPKNQNPMPPYQPSVLQELNKLPSRTLADSPYHGVLSYDKLKPLLTQQLERELIGTITVKSVAAPSEVSPQVAACRAKWESMKAMWKKSLVTSFKWQKNLLRMQSGHKEDIGIYPFVCTLPDEDYIDILLNEVVNMSQMSEGYSQTTLALDIHLGTKVMNRYLVMCKAKYNLLDRLEQVYDDYLKYFENISEVSKYNCREKWQQIENQLNMPVNPLMSDHVWPSAVTSRIGKFLYNIIIDAIKIDVKCLNLERSVPHYVPAAYQVYRHYAEGLKIELKPHPMLVKLYKAAEMGTLVFDATMCPTIVPPLPWTHTKSGGYLIKNCAFSRLPEHSSGTAASITDTVKPETLNPVFDSLNQLAASPWIINKPMLDLIMGIFRNKGMPDVDIPPPVSECPAPPSIAADMSPEEKKIVFKEQLRLKKKRNEMFSLWCDALYKLSIANHFRDDVFFYPHNIDFRGRTYPIPPHFHHLGGDMTRSILLFAKGMPLGQNGLDWLKIHLINLTGLKKKCSIADRLAYANEIIDDILDSADHPLTGRLWWKSSDDPWQTLACCKEIANAMRSPDHTKFISHFPIHQDGSCNGLQHYAALGRDKDGAEKVNLAPLDLPQDVYSGVAALVEESRRKDAEDDVKVAKSLDGYVGRKVVKQTVMTIVYGVTKYGAKAQIHKQLEDLKGFDQKQSWPAATYLAGKTFQSIGQMFSSTRKIQEWFVECARLISVGREQPVSWITPLGLPVVQPYFKKSTNGMARQTLHLATNEGKVNVMKQKNAFPPNYIHSLDSVHMMLTCLHSARAGISFVSVHDSYWTHPASVMIMNKICREQFVALHELPLLEDLSNHLVKNFSFPDSDIQHLHESALPVTLNKTLKSVPSKGVFDLKSVLQSTYFFS